jgi:preprotein translocase subunit Sss1
VRLRQTLRALGPTMSRPTWREALRASLGAGAGLALCGAILITVSSWVGAAHACC